MRSLPASRQHGCPGHRWRHHRGPSQRAPGDRQAHRRGHPRDQGPAKACGVLRQGSQSIHSQPGQGPTGPAGDPDQPDQPGQVRQASWHMSFVRATTCWSTRKSSAKATGTLSRSIPSTQAGWINFGRPSVRPEPSNVVCGHRITLQHQHERGSTPCNAICLPVFSLSYWLRLLAGQKFDPAYKPEPGDSAVIGYAVPYGRHFNDELNQKYVFLGFQAFASLDGINGTGKLSEGLEQTPTYVIPSSHATA